MLGPRGRSRLYNGLEVGQLGEEVLIRKGLGSIRGLDTFLRRGWGGGVVRRGAVVIERGVALGVVFTEVVAGGIVVVTYSLSGE